MQMSKEEGFACLKEKNFHVYQLAAITRQCIGDANFNPMMLKSPFGVRVCDEPFTRPPSNPELKQRRKLKMSIYAVVVTLIWSRVLKQIQTASCFVCGYYAEEDNVANLLYGPQQMQPQWLQ